MKRTLKQQEKLEALMRVDIENMPYKYRDIRAMFYGGIGAYKDISNEEIDEQIKDLEIEISEEDKEWASYQIKQ